MPALDPACAASWMEAGILACRSNMTTSWADGLASLSLHMIATCRALKSDELRNCSMFLWMVMEILRVVAIQRSIHPRLQHGSDYITACQSYGKVLARQCYDLCPESNKCRVLLFQWFICATEPSIRRVRRS